MAISIASAATVPLAQHLISCPECGCAAAVHVSLAGVSPEAVRVVCARGCPDTESLRAAAVSELYPVATVA